MLETDTYDVHADYYDHIAPDTNIISYETTDENISNIINEIGEMDTQSAEVL